jgi:ferritin-like metal-binding protein YciE
MGTGSACPRNFLRRASSFHADTPFRGFEGPRTGTSVSGRVAHVGARAPAISNVNTAKQETMEDKTHRLIRYLNDTYATEMGGAAALDDLFRRTNDPDVRAVVVEHLVVTKSQAARLLERIRALGGSEADAKVAFQTLAAKGSKLINLFHDQEDKQTQDLIKTYALEHFEIGVYLSLAAYARAIGDEETARLADTIGAEERDAAQRMEALIPQVSVQAIRRTAEAVEAAQAVEAAAPNGSDKKSVKKLAKKIKERRGGGTEAAADAATLARPAGRRPGLSMPIVAGGAALGLGVGAALATVAVRRRQGAADDFASTATTVHHDRQPRRGPGRDGSDRRGDRCARYRRHQRFRGGHRHGRRHRHRDG